MLVATLRSNCSIAEDFASEVSISFHQYNQIKVFVNISCISLFNFFDFQNNNECKKCKLN